MSDSSSHNNLKFKWQEIARQLNVSIELDFTIKIENTELTFPVRVLNFGGPLGTLLFQSRSVDFMLLDQLFDLGYALSSFSDTVSSDFVLEEVIELLVDWKWTGKDQEKPLWLDP